MRGRTDANQSLIVRELRKIGATVQSLADLGDGTPDLVVGFRGINTLIEVKDWKQVPSKQKLTPAEKKWHTGWQGQVAIAMTPDEALRLIGAIK